MNSNKVGLGRKQNIFLVWGMGAYSYNRRVEDMLTLPPLVTVEFTRPSTNINTKITDLCSCRYSVGGGAGTSPQSPTIRAWSIQPDQSRLVLNRAYAAGGQTGFVIFFPRSMHLSVRYAPSYWTILSHRDRSQQGGGQQ